MRLEGLICGWFAANAGRRAIETNAKAGNNAGQRG
jgi:hypothetical protein